MKSLYIIVGSILAMASVVLILPPKKTVNAKDKASIPLDEIDAFILKECGIDLSPEEKEITRQELAHIEARDKAEIKKHGQILTDDERSVQWELA